MKVNISSLENKKMGMRKRVEMKMADSKKNIDYVLLNQ
jgi:hypothetical protein